MQRRKPEQDHTSKHADAYLAPFTFQPIGKARSPYTERFGTPRQPTIVTQVKGDAMLPGRIELLPEYADSLDGLLGHDRIWVLFAFHLNSGHGQRVRSPRDESETRGLFATRSPHRPNPIGLSCLRLTGIEGSVLHVLGLDLLDHTPIFDVKPYVPYADAFPEARAGWLEGRAPGEPDHYVPPAPEARTEPSAASAEGPRASSDDMKKLLVHVVELVGRSPVLRPRHQTGAGGSQVSPVSASR
jgi:tRNA (adenine37-N6)-methyltransferase